MHDASKAIAQVRKSLKACEARAEAAEGKLRERDTECLRLQERLEAFLDAENENDANFKLDFAANLVAELQEPDHKNAVELEAECRQLKNELEYCEEEEKKLKSKIENNNDLQQRLQDTEKQLQEERKVCNVWRKSVEDLERKLTAERAISANWQNMWQLLKNKIEMSGMQSSTKTLL